MIIDSWQTNLIFCGAGHKQTVNNFGKVQDRSKTLATNFYLTSNVSSKAVGCFKSYQHQESATYVNLIKYSGSAGHLAFCYQKTSRNLPRERDGPCHDFFLGLHLRLCHSHLPRTYTKRIYKHVFQIMSLLYVMYARCLHIIGIVILSFACLLSYAILSLIVHHWTCDEYLFILIYGTV